MNVSCRYHEGKDRFGDPYPLHPLDEVQENINLWTKKILLGPDEMSWRLHSPNVACAHMCVNHEETEYVNGSLDYSDLQSVSSKNLYRSTKTTSPAKRIEQQRLYEWSLIMFGELVNNRSCIVKDGYDAITKLKIKLASNNVRDKDDALEMCITNIFGNDDDDKTDDLDTIEVIEDGYNGYNPIAIVDDENNDEEDTVINTSNTSSIERCVSKMSLSNVFLLGVDKMNELNIPKQREIKKDQLKRTIAFFL